MMSGCVAAWIDHGTGKYRDILYEDQTRTTIRARLGEPIEVYPSQVQRRFDFKIPEAAVSYDMYAVRGKVAKVADGSEEATLNAITLGTGEIISIPLVLLEVVGETAFGKYYLVFFYDSVGKKVDKLVLLPNGNERWPF